MKRFCVAMLIAAVVPATSYGQTVIVNETFDDYDDQAAFQAAWRPDNGDGIADALDPTEAGFLVPNTDGFLNAPNDNPPDLQGKGVNVPFATNESVVEFSIEPTATQWVRYGGDIFNDGPITNDSASGMRQSIGLRNDNVDRDPATFGCQCGVNFLELGFYNTAADDPRTPEPDLVPNTQFQYRITLFSQLAEPDNVPNPSWLSFQLDPALDVPDGDPPVGDYNEDNFVDAADYTVWRDTLEQTVTTPGDGADGDLSGTIDAADYDLWKTNFGMAAEGDGLVDINDIGAGWHRFSALVKPDSITVELDLFRDGINNATGEVGIDASETWKAQMNTAFPGMFNSLRIGGPSGVSPNDQAVFDNVFLELITPPAGAALSSGAAVPEPASVALALLSCAGLMGCRRSRSARS